MIKGLIRLEDAVMALNEDVARLEHEGAIGIDIVEMRNRVLEWLYELPTIPQKEYAEQQVRDAFNNGFFCGNNIKWIPIDEEYPIDSEEVVVTLVWDEYGDSIIAYGHYSARFDKWKLYSDAEGEVVKGYTVKAWMPLPNPYEAEQTEPSEKHECVKDRKKPCTACKYYDWEVDEYIGFREICYNIGNCEFKNQKIAELITEQTDCLRK